MRSLHVISAAAGVFLAAHSAPALSDAPGVVDGAAPESAELVSTWGPFPSLGDSVVADFEPPPTPAWEHVVNAPHWLLTLPLRLVGAGFEETLEFLEESAAIERLKKLYPLRIGPGRLTGGVSVGGGDGFGGNVNFLIPSPFGRDGAFQIKGAANEEDDRKTVLGLRVPVGRGGRWEFALGHRQRAETRYYGLGPASPQERHCNFLQEASWAGVSYRRLLGESGVSVEGSALVSGIHARGTDQREEPSLAEAFPDDPPAGYKERSDGISVGLEMRHENADQEGRPERGGIRRARASYYQELGTFRDDDAAPGIAFWAYRAELQQFVPLWYSKRTLALRALLTWLDSTGETAIPFQRLLTNDDPDLLRGYKDYRFRDRGLALFSAEYRWPLWVNSSIESTGADVYAFVDLGQVFGEFAEIGSENLTTSYGGGFRLAAWGGFVGRLEVGISEEDTLLRLRADQVFQFVKGGLFHGRTPVPER
jgi:hypothetical protein